MFGVDALIEKNGFVSLFGRVGKIPQDQNPPNGYWFKIDEQGRWELRTAKVAIASGQTFFATASWHALRLKFTGKRIQAFVDHRQVARVENGEYGAGWLASVAVGMEPSSTTWQSWATPSCSSRSKKSIEVGRFASGTMRLGPTTPRRDTAFSLPSNVAEEDFGTEGTSRGGGSAEGRAIRGQRNDS